jgi:uncharacterized membrane protein YoaK (UPF0700 family)
VRTGTLLLLTFATGVVDAATFLGLGQVFAAMQTGNVIFLGVGVAGSDGAPVVAPLVALGAFLAGGLAAAALLAAARRRPAQATGEPVAHERAAGGTGAGALRAGAAAPAVALAIEVALLAAAAALVAATSPAAGDAAAVAAIALVACAMGLRNTAVRSVGGQNLATTVLNLTVVGIAAGDATVAGRSDLAQRALALGLILAGAAVGALLVQADVAIALAAAAVVSLAALLTLRARPSAARRRA